jgi:mono/diheme cytochrome c family protein
MRNFIVGVVATLIVAVVTVYGVSHFGLIDMRADQQPSRLETSVAGRAMDASTERHAPQAKNPIEPTEANLQGGLKIYITYCAQCHGDPAMPESALGKAEYPPAPQFTRDPADMPENQNFYIIQHGVRLTAMPGWEGVLNQDQTWKVTTFLSHMDKLPSAVEKEWKASPGQLTR